MKRLTWFILLILSTLTASAQAIITIGDKDISKQEFEYYYQKNNAGQIQDISRNDYLEMFIDFKLKVEEAYAMQYDTASSFQEELAGYRNQLITPYLTDSAKLKELVKEAYQFLLEDVEASHILFAVNSPEEADAALQKAKKARKGLKKSNFAKVATELSDDPSVQFNQGYLGWFTGGQMVYPFEKAAYQLKKGKISQPIRSDFGYHLILLHDRRPSKGEIRVAHILKRKPYQADSAQLATVKEEVFKIHQQLKEGANFAEFARLYSDDKETLQGGELPWISLGKTPPEFEKAAFDLNAENRLSEPVEAVYGWHLIYLLEKRPIGSFESYQEKLTNRVKMDQRRAIVNRSFIDKLKKEYNFKIGKNDTIATFANQIISKEDFGKFIESVGDTNVTQEAYIDVRLMQYENQQLENKYPEFGMLMNEYREGILLFNICNDLIWSRASKDTEGLQKFFEENRADYPSDYTYKKGPVVNDYQVYLEKQWVQQLREKYTVTIHHDVLNNIP